MRMTQGFPGDFCREEDGNVTIFSIFMVVLILTITGASVDIMRFEATRAKMQSTMDRAVLAAADLDQEQDPTAVVNDYMLKAGLQDVLSSVVVDQGLNFRTVSAEGSKTLDTIFLKLSGFDTLTAPASAIAEEKISNVEISLVLDTSGSMGSHSRMQNMRNAAKQFVDTVIQPAGSPGLTTISLVPYHASVNIGSTLAPYFNLTEEHDYSNCAVFSNASFSDTAINPGSSMQRMSHFDPISTGTTQAQIQVPWCYTGNTGAMVMHSADASLLKSRIDDLQAWGNTAIDMGMKWGVGLLDPAIGTAISDMASDGLITAEAADRPAAYNDPEAIKFVVVMTDGENTQQWDLKSKYKSGWSNVWIDERGTSNHSDDRFSLLVRDWAGTSNDLYFRKRFENSSWSNRYRNTPDGGSNARRMTNAELFARFGTRAVAQMLMVQPYYDGFVSYDDYFDMYYAYETIVTDSAADARMSTICDAAKQEGVVVFAIAFEAPQRGKDALQDCASSPSHYFDVEGVEITDTFHAIARQINALRLIQ